MGQSKIIINTTENQYTFQKNDKVDDTIYNRMCAYINNNPVAYVDIEVNPQSTPQPPDIKPTIVPDTIGTYPYGTSTNNLTIIYHADQNYINKLDVDILNQYTIDYLERIFPGEDYSGIKYFGEDGGGIYAYLKGPNVSKEYNNAFAPSNFQKYDDATVYKVYVKGSAEIVGFHGENSGKYEVLLSNGYCHEIGNTLYLFILNKAGLIKINNIHWTADVQERTAESFARSSNLNLVYEITRNDYSGEDIMGKYFISIGSEIIPEDIREPQSIDSENMPGESDLPLLFNSGEISKLITSETMTEIEYFSSAANIEEVSLTGIETIGTCSFYGSKISGEILTQATKLKKIGDYAFAKTSNLDLDSGGIQLTQFPSPLEHIGEYAFKESMGLDGINLINCKNLAYVGKEAFANCTNLNHIHYLESQIANREERKNLLYLPPNEGDGHIYVPRNGSESVIGVRVTAMYSYTDEDYENARKETDLQNPSPNHVQAPYEITNKEEEQGKINKTFIGCDSADWYCYP